MNFHVGCLIFLNYKKVSIFLIICLVKKCLFISYFYFIEMFNVMIFDIIQHK
jgi:hypothetical protein